MRAIFVSLAILYSLNIYGQTAKQTIQHETRDVGEPFAIGEIGEQRTGILKDLPPAESLPLLSNLRQLENGWKLSLGEPNPMVYDF